MSRRTQRLVFISGLTGLLASAALPVWASSSVVADGSSASSTSVGSSSTSVGKSSDSSSGKDKEVAEGDYRVVEVGAAAEQPGKLRVTLQAAADDSPKGELQLTLPPEAVTRGQLARGAVVSAKRRAYGVEFAAGAPREPFFLVMRDDWFRELDSRLVSF
jgi:hypothetical protein